MARQVLSREDIENQAAMLEARVKKNWRQWAQRMQQQGTGAWRLYDRDIPEIRLVIDVYEEHLVVAEYQRELTDNSPGWLEAMGEAARIALGLPHERLHLKRRRTRPEEGERYRRLEHRGERLLVREGPYRFQVNLDDYIDTGLFADHRLTRRRVEAESAGRAVLNLYAYTGSFSVAAGRGGARSVTSVDANPRYLDWARQNLAENGLLEPGLGEQLLVQADVRHYLEEARGLGRRWDLIVLDPPSYSERPDAAALDLQRHHPELIARTLHVMVPGGVLWFSTNHQRFAPQLHGLPVSQLRELTEETVPPDYRNRQAHRCWRMVKAS
jgi:23S rRNA (cytosine1962-C5)-methyltransferase